MNHDKLRNIALRIAAWVVVATTPCLGADAPAPTWEQVIVEVADPLVCPMYRGLQIELQKDLTPLRRDPDSGLWEFLLEDSGEPPRIRPDAPYQLPERFGVILVLIPPGTVRIGSRFAGDESPEHLVRLDAFYVSKYELTQAQWSRLANNPSFFAAGTVHGGEVMTARHPVEKVTWSSARNQLRRWHLQLPTEAQWEAACRAQTASRWSFGDAAEDLRHHGNAHDQSATDYNDHFAPAEWNDGHPFTAAVGSYAPNGYGLYDMHGNVWEWCEDAYSRAGYVGTPRPGDGLHEVEAEDRAIRGGSYFTPANQVRSAERTGIPLKTTARGVGVRPARFPVAAER